MKRKTKGIIAAAFLGTIMVTSTAMFALPGIVPSDTEETRTLTGTPADHFPDDQRPTFCGTGEAKSNRYVKEFKIPTECTQPLAIIAGPSGNIWFTETNTGNIVKFDPVTELFTEYPNPDWPEKSRSMMWGIDYSPDGNIWYTDNTHNVIWKFSPEEQTFQGFSYPESEAPSMPQRLEFNNEAIVVNDFTGSKITIFDPNQSGDVLEYKILSSPVPDSFTGAFAIDDDNNLWYTNWKVGEGGVLVKFNTQTESFDGTFVLPFGVTTPNGLSFGPDGKIWGTDTESSLFFGFDPETNEFTKFITPPPPVSAYGNDTGSVKNPISRPYWNKFDDKGRLWFNEQTSNGIAVFGPSDESLVEYLIPSKNPNWADCGEDNSDCGLANVLDFAIQGDKIWFTEWVENNIGVIDTTSLLPFEIQVEPKVLTLSKGEKTNVSLTIIPSFPLSDEVTVTSSSTAAFDDIKVFGTDQMLTLNDKPQTILLEISVAEMALSGKHKVAIAVPYGDVTISKYVTVIITQ